MNAVRTAIAENVGGIGHRAVGAEHQFGIAEVPTLTGKTAVITGATEGIGYGVAYTLLSKGIEHVDMLSGNPEVAESAMKEISSELGEEYSRRVTWHQVDLSDWDAVRSTAKTIARSRDRLDILVNNAGRGIMTYQLAEKTGIDRHMSINHIGHVVLTSTLLPLLKKTAADGHTVRISNQSSNAHQAAPKNTAFASVDELNTDNGANAQYGRSKLANLLYTRYLAQHLTSKHPRILVNATHPGFVDTAQSGRHIHEPFPIAGYGVSKLMKPLKKDQWEGAVPTLFAATKTERSGEYICSPAISEPGSERSQDKELGERLMKLTREILCDKLEVDTWEDY